MRDGNRAKFGCRHRRRPARPVWVSTSVDHDEFAHDTARPHMRKGCFQFGHWHSAINHGLYFPGRVPGKKFTHVLLVDLGFNARQAAPKTPTIDAPLSSGRFSGNDGIGPAANPITR
mgnify:CR=1 FL=1